MWRRLCKNWKVLSRSFNLFLSCGVLLHGAEKVDFARDVQPILHTRCAGCHGGDKLQGGLSVSTRTALLKKAVIPGSSAKSPLIARLTATGPGRMPLGQAPLGDREIGVLRSWIDEGAEWHADTSIEPRRPKVPANGHTHPIDAFVARYAKAKGISVVPPASDATFLRRAWLDLTGLLPSPEEQDSFRRDRRSTKRTQLIDRLLHEDRKYAEHWITLWNDLLRNEDGVAYPGETREWITDWLLNALETNMPYDLMVRSLLNPQEKGAPRGFLAGINWGGDVSASQSVPMQAAQNSAQVFLGANLKCASCHDSFVSRWKLADVFSLAAFFADRPLEMARCEVKTGKTATPAFLFPELEQEEMSLSARARAAALFTSSKNGRFARTIVNRYWRALMGRGLVEPVDDLDAPSWDRDLLDWLAADFADHGYDLRFLLRRIMTSRTYQAMAVDEDPPKDAAFVFRGPLTRRLTAEQFMDAIGAVTGEWKVYDRLDGKPATYERQWRFRSDRMTRALGRPDRSQVITTRTDESTTLQALELVNGEVFADQLMRGAQRLMSGPPQHPQSIFDSGMVRAKPVNVDIDIQSASRLWLVMQDLGSYDPPKVVARWLNAELIGPNGSTRLTDFAGTPFWKTSFDIGGRGFTRFRATVAVDEASLRPETTGKVRFFVFTEEPDSAHLVRVDDSTPSPIPPRLAGNTLVSRLFRHMLSRDPGPAESRKASALMEEGAEGLEDLLWVLFLSPEFQLIR